MELEEREREAVDRGEASWKGGDRGDGWELDGKRRGAGRVWKVAG